MLQFKTKGSVKKINTVHLKCSNVHLKCSPKCSNFNSYKKFKFMVLAINDKDLIQG